MQRLVEHACAFLIITPRNLVDTGVAPHQTTWRIASRLENSDENVSSLLLFVEVKKENVYPFTGKVGAELLTSESRTC